MAEILRLETEQDEPDDDEGRWRIESLERTIGEVEGHHEEGKAFDWHGERLRSGARHLREYWKELPAAMRPRALEAASKADTLAESADNLYHMQVVSDGRTAEYASVTAAMAAAKRIRTAWEWFKVHEPGAFAPEHFRQALERCAWHRARKRLDDADVAAGGGNEKKAARLRGEAVVLLRQDWQRVFPEEEPPEIT